MIQSDVPLGAGAQRVRFDFAYDGGRPGAGGTGKLYVNDTLVGTGGIEKMMRDESLRITAMRSI